MAILSILQFNQLGFLEQIDVKAGTKTKIARGGALSEADLCAFELLCETLATVATARLAIERDGTATRTADGGLKPHPSVRIMETASAQAAALLREFGLTPKARTGVSVSPPSKEENPFVKRLRQTEPETLPYANPSSCSVSADAGQTNSWGEDQ
jgi:P27 family predicted phage terminase small subunit